ncbi:MAG TPA: hypothetical protein VF584_13755 [Longimicrobium sp.]
MSEQRLRIAVTTIALALAAAHHLWPEIRIDAFTGILLVVSALPWVGSIIKAVELPGGVKLELQEIRHEASEARGAAESAALQAGAALAATTATTAPNPVDGSQIPGFEQLAAEYNHIRETMNRSPARLSAMNAVAGRMLALAPQHPSFDVRSALASVDRGMRLAAYIYLYGKPDPQYLGAVTDALTGLEDKPFNEYWAIRAIGNLAAVGEGGRLPTVVCRKLHTYYRSLAASTDRHFELGRVLATACDKDSE